MYIHHHEMVLGKARPTPVTILSGVSAPNKCGMNCSEQTIEIHIYNSITRYHERGNK